MKKGINKLFMNTKYIALISLILLFLSGYLLASTCHFRCVHCGQEIFAGCQLPVPNNGYCNVSPNGQHTFVLINKQ